MRAGTPFRRARMMMAAIMAAVASFGNSPLRLQQEVAAIGPYKIKRKSSGAQHRSRHTTAQAQRTALKARNRQRNRQAHRG